MLHLEIFVGMFVEDFGNVKRYFQNVDFFGKFTN